MSFTEKRVASTTIILSDTTTSSGGRFSLRSSRQSARGAKTSNTGIRLPNQFTAVSGNVESSTCVLSAHGERGPTIPTGQYPQDPFRTGAVGYQDQGTNKGDASSTRISYSPITYASVAARKPPNPTRSLLETKPTGQPEKPSNVTKNQSNHIQLGPKANNPNGIDPLPCNSGYNGSLEQNSTQSSAIAGCDAPVVSSPSSARAGSSNKRRSKNKKKVPGIIELGSVEFPHTSSPLQKSRRPKLRASSLSSLGRSRTLPHNSSGARRYNAPIEISLSQFISAEPQVPFRKPVTSHASVVQKTQLKGINENARIGKVRETPKTKRPTTLKRAILAERETRKNRRCTSAPATARSGALSTGVPSNNGDVQLFANQEVTTKTGTNVQRPTLHSSSKSDNKQQDDLVTELMQRLSQLQDRAYVKFAHAPHHRKRTKRYVCGLREVVKHLRLKHIRLVLIARDLEGGASRHCRKLTEPPPATNEDDTQLSALENILDQIWHLATEDAERPTPILLTHTRRFLGYLSHKSCRVSVIGILSDAGAESIMQNLLALKTGINLPQPLTSFGACERDQPAREESQQMMANCMWHCPSDLQGAFASLSVGT
ncbi:Selenocysteine insertion sequence-binding protein 2 [Clonorchis sinensis]|uniref:Selenocysteine insertion sequence-binding protein 2 n=1 Tax=Clonorchis sinensis TaxID=79923 RepID=A0A8T1MY84_CLOSI|nr:Selenocysteine insertion sequence-binding protein 2 [Clonorchis sinensis]